MGNLNSLKLLSTQRPISLPVTEQRRNKLIRRLDEQIALATAVHTGSTYAPKKIKSHKNDKTGERMQAEVTKRVKAWWFPIDAGKFALCVRFGPKPLELSKGKYAIEISNTQDAIKALEVVKAAVLAGELDEAIESVANKLREGFSK